MNLRTIAARLDNLEQKRRPRRSGVHWHSGHDLASACSILAKVRFGNQTEQRRNHGKIFRVGDGDCPEGLTFGHVLRGERLKVCELCAQRQGFSNGPHWRCGKLGCQGVNTPERAAERGKAERKAGPLQNGDIRFMSPQGKLVPSRIEDEESVYREHEDALLPAISVTDFIRRLRANCRLEQLA